MKILARDSAPGTLGACVVLGFRMIQDPPVTALFNCFHLNEANNSAGRFFEEPYPLAAMLSIARERSMWVRASFICWPYRLGSKGSIFRLGR